MTDGDGCTKADCQRFLSKAFSLHQAKARVKLNHSTSLPAMDVFIAEHRHIHSSLTYRSVSINMGKPGLQPSTRGRYVAWL